MNTDRMLFFDNLREDDNTARAVRIVNAWKEGRLSGEDELFSDYYELQRHLLRSVRYGDRSLTYWQNYILELAAAAENAFSLMAESGAEDPMLMRLAEGDLLDIQALLQIDWGRLSEQLEPDRPCVCNSRSSGIREDSRFPLLFKAMSASPEHLTQKVAEYYRSCLCGMFGRYRVFAWDGSMKGVEEPDPVTFEELIGYDLQQQQLIRNTEMFMEGRRANNVLLYGDKGTGKSSSVKALVNRFADQGLRMISLPKDRIMEITRIMDLIADRGCRFIIFIDDLSFEATEIEYKKFKSVLEGDVEIRPDNVLVYVTSNRRNLVKELWSDRENQLEVHGSDGIQETQSLADRFGLMITFPSPGKSLYNEMVLSIARREGVDVDEETLLREANRWDMRQTSRSGRSARQFITHISGK